MAVHLLPVFAIVDSGRGRDKFVDDARYIRHLPMPADWTWLAADVPMLASDT